MAAHCFIPEAGLVGLEVKKQLNPKVGDYNGVVVVVVVDDDDDDDDNDDDILLCTLICNER
jgi:hypothetical protein